MCLFLYFVDKYVFVLSRIQFFFLVHSGWIWIHLIDIQRKKPGKLLSCPIWRSLSAVNQLCLNLSAQKEEKILGNYNHTWNRISTRNLHTKELAGLFNLIWWNCPYWKHFGPYCPLRFARSQFCSCHSWQNSLPKLSARVPICLISGPQEPWRQTKPLFKVPSPWVHLLHLNECFEERTTASTFGGGTKGQHSSLSTGMMPP